MNNATRTALRTALSARSTLESHNAAIDLDTALQADPDPVCAKASREMNRSDSSVEAIRAAAQMLPLPRYQLQTRDAWAGRPGGTWLPAVAGTVNQTGNTDEEASTFDSEAEAKEAAAELKSEGLEDWRVVEL